MPTREQQATWDRDISQLYGNCKVPPSYGEHLQDVLVASSETGSFPVVDCHDSVSTDLRNSVRTQNLTIEDVMLRKKKIHLYTSISKPNKSLCSISQPSESVIHTIRPIEYIDEFLVHYSTRM